MDVGVGMFVFSSGLTTGKRLFNKSSSFYKLVTSSFPLLILGLGRLLSVKGVNYQVITPTTVDEKVLNGGTLLGTCIRVRCSLELLFHTFFSTIAGTLDKRFLWIRSSVFSWYFCRHR
jgi:hypothetical protein